MLSLLWLKNLFISQMPEKFGLTLVPKTLLDFLKKLGCIEQEIRSCLVMIQRELHMKIVVKLKILLSVTATRFSVPQLTTLMTVMFKVTELIS